jgi:YD repeat-containing protein
MNPLNNLYTKTVVATLGLILTTLSHATDYTYDELHRLIKVTYASGQTIHYTYDAGGNLLSALESTDSPPPTDDNPTATKQDISPATCQIYAVNDKGLNHSQFITIRLNDLKVTELGPLYKGHDIESLAIHPKTNTIYAASGDNVTNGNNGHFYRVDAQTGGLFPVGSTGFTEIEDLAFSPDGTLWAWAKGEGLITINLTTGVGTLETPSNILIEGLTLSQEKGRMIFYGSANTKLWVYDMDANTLDVACTNLFGETEALEMVTDGLKRLPAGFLLVGTHNVPLGLHAFNPETCEIITADETLTNQFNDVEGIALPVEACNTMD